MTGFTSDSADDARIALADAVKIAESGRPALVHITTGLSARAT